MKQLVLIILLVIPVSVFSQIVDGVHVGDINYIRFNGVTSPVLISDTASTPLWQMGHSHKGFFGIDTSGQTRMMTDTLNPYRINANNWFTIKAPHYNGIVIGFWHKFQTDSGKDGGIVEFSTDSGRIWKNFKGDCNGDGAVFGVRTENFYGASDTLQTGEQAFSGTKSVTQYSRFQFFSGMGPFLPCLPFMDTILIRFRFKSDSVADSMAGWEIDSIRTEHYFFPDAVNTISKDKELKIVPSPSYDGYFQLPEIENEDHYTVEIYNAVGSRILMQGYTRTFDLSRNPAGMYFYRITNGYDNYRGRLIKE